MTIQEAYEIFYGKTKTKITEEYLVKNYTKEIIGKDYRKLTSKYHPDVHRQENDKYNEKMKEINLAYEVLLKSHKLTSKKANKPSKTIKSLSGYTDEDLKTLIESYKKLAYYTYYLRKYKIITDLYKNTDYYYREIKDLYLPSKIYESIEEYNKINTSAKKELEEVKKKYNILKQLLKSKKINMEILTTRLKELAGDYYDLLDDEFLKVEVSQWYKSNIKEDENKYHDQVSYIRNIKNILKRILNNSKALNASICQTILCINNQNALEELSKSENFVQKIKILQFYRQKRHKYISQNNDWIRKANNYQLGMEELKNSEIDEDFVKNMEKELKDLIPEEYLSLLAKDRVIAKIQGGRNFRDSVEYDESNLKFSLEYKKAMRQIETKIIEIRNLFLTNGKEEPKLKGKYDSNNILDFLIESEKQALVLYYKIFICYYTVNNHDILDYEIDDVYQNLFDVESPSELNPERIDMFYDIITYKYKSSKVKDFKLNPAIEKEAKRNMANDSKGLIDYLGKANIPISRDLVIKANKIPNLDLIDAYKIFEAISNKVLKRYPLKNK